MLARRLLVGMVFMGGCSASPTSVASDDVRVAMVGSVRIEYFDLDQPLADEFRSAVAAAVANAEAFADLRFKSGFTLHVYPTRNSLTAYWTTAWNDPGLVPQCWMIASSSRDYTAFLSPRIWTSENCGHDGNSAAYVGRVVAHEAIHILQAQNNPSPDINAVQPTKWLNEGAAVLGSGEFDERQVELVRNLVQRGYVPGSLAVVWTGEQGYAVAGSLTQYVDSRWGRVVLRQILLKTSNVDILAVLGVSESEFIDAWKQSVLR